MYILLPNEFSTDLCVGRDETLMLIDTGSAGVSYEHCLRAHHEETRHEYQSRRTTKAPHHLLYRQTRLLSAIRKCFGCLVFHRDEGQYPLMSMVDFSEKERHPREYVLLNLCWLREGRPKA